MPRLRNELTGAVMTVEDSIAAHLGSEWVPGEQQPEPKRSPGRKKSE